MANLWVPCELLVPVAVRHHGWGDLRPQIKIRQSRTKAQPRETGRTFPQYPENQKINKLTRLQPAVSLDSKRKKLLLISSFNKNIFKILKFSYKFSKTFKIFKLLIKFLKFVQIFTNFSQNTLTFVIYSKCSTLSVYH